MVALATSPQGKIRKSVYLYRHETIFWTNRLCICGDRMAETKLQFPKYLFSSSSSFL